MVNEAWRPIPGHNGYEVSDHGRVRSYRNRQGHPQATPRVLSPGLVGGYRYIKLGRSRQARIHRLVLEAFVGPCPPDMLCRHLDGDSLNNHLSNLRWGTPEENYADRRVHGTHNSGSRNGRAVLVEADVVAIREQLAGGARLADVALSFGVGRSVVAHISAGHTWREAA